MKRTTETRTAPQASTPVPVIDLFAGPGGLGEGFASARTGNDTPAFRLALSVEKDPVAHQTLELRAFFRQFEEGRTPADYYRFATGSLRREDLFARHRAEADHASKEACCMELGPETRSNLEERVKEALGGASRSVLIGGPPCQAYSLVGRSRNRGIATYDADKDQRHTLYVEYLHVLATQWPAVFVMENVKGLLSARFQGDSMFERILRDLKDPAEALGFGKGPRREGAKANDEVPRSPYTYRLLALARYSESSLDLFEANGRGFSDPRDFIVRAERHGVPQARHRLIILGVRSDIAIPDEVGLLLAVPPGVDEVIGTLPRLRSGVSREADSTEEWRRTVTAAMRTKWFSTLKTTMPKVARELQRAVSAIAREDLSRGAEAVNRQPKRPQALSRWFATASTPAILNHATRAHIAGDLHRYLFAAAFARANGRSPTLIDFPKALLPEHRSASNAIEGSPFNDRFRVQLGDAPSTTITSHISKDGHYYIHPDPTQCRSLTVREAARLQTFPDNYFFCGSRTAQYHQVGNAVPPYLARQIADVVAHILKHDEAVKRTRHG